jgi:hypothetical protein
MDHGSGYGRVLHERFVPVQGSLFSGAGLDRPSVLQHVNPVAELEVFAQTASEEEFDEQHRAFTMQGSSGAKEQQQIAKMGTENFAQDDKEYNYTLDRPIQGIRLRPSSIFKRLIHYASSPNPRVSYNYVPRLPLHLQGNLVRSLVEDTSFLRDIYPLINGAAIGHHADSIAIPNEGDRTCYSLTGSRFDRSTSTFKVQPASGDITAS